jgi:hypothetical protein
MFETRWRKLRDNELNVIYAADDIMLIKLRWIKCSGTPLFTRLIHRNVVLLCVYSRKTTVYCLKIRYDQFIINPYQFSSMIIFSANSMVCNICGRYGVIKLPETDTLILVDTENVI